MCSTHSADANFFESHFNTSVIADLKENPLICVVFCQIFWWFLFLTCATFDPNMDIELSTTCAMDTDGLYNGGMSHPYHSFSASLYRVENILLCSAPLLGRVNELNLVHGVLNYHMEYLYQISNKIKGLISTMTLFGTDKCLAITFFIFLESKLKCLILLSYLCD